MAIAFISVLPYEFTFAFCIVGKPMLSSFMKANTSSGNRAN